MERDVQIEELKKQKEELDLLARQYARSNPRPTDVAQNSFTDAIQGGGYKVPTLTERIEQLEKKVNHLERLIGIK